jgi:hypothetical protein
MQGRYREGEHPTKGGDGVDFIWSSCGMMVLLSGISTPCLHRTADGSPKMAGSRGSTSRGCI